MHSLLEKLFTFLSKQLLISLLIFLALSFIFMKFYEKFLLKRVKFFKSHDKEICFGILLTGLVFFIPTLLIKMSCNISVPFIWLLCSGSLVIGGGLGLIPFSFIERKNKKH